MPTDFDNRRDIDLLLIPAAAPPLLFRNLRDGTFRDVAADVGLALDRPAAMAALGDLNKDGYADIFFPGRDGAGTLAMSDGRSRFTTSPAPAEAAGARAAQFIDYDNDGLLDLFLLTARGPRLIRQPRARMDGRVGARHSAGDGGSVGRGNRARGRRRERRRPH